MLTFSYPQSGSNNWTYNTEIPPLNLLSDIELSANDVKLIKYIYLQKILNYSAKTKRRVQHASCVITKIEECEELFLMDAYNSIMYCYHENNIYTQTRSMYNTQITLWISNRNNPTILITEKYWLKTKSKTITYPNPQKGIKWQFIENGIINIV